MDTQFSPGSLVHARGREWTVLPGSTKDLYLLRPLAGGSANTVTGVLSELEKIEPAEFLFPRLEEASDAVSARILRDAARLSIRSGVGPFRSFSRISVEPRPYQLVPLMLALRQESTAIRLLIADDVGVGKTVEAMLIVRELLDRHEIKNFSVLCPAHLVSQWAAELKNKFHIQAVEVTARKADLLEKNCSPGKGIFDEYPYTIVSIDFIKTERNRNEFLAKCPDLILVDEAHECADAGTKSGLQQQRHKLLKDIAKNPSKNILLLTATPHSGKMQAFRSLMSILNETFANTLPDDLSGDKNRHLREELAKYFVQRRRADIKDYLGDSIFPKRETSIVKYPFVESNKILTQKLLERAKEFFSLETPQTGTKQFNKQALWWSCFTLALALCSSPYAALTSLCRRSRLLAAKDISDMNKQGEQSIFGIKDTPYGEDYADSDSEEDLLYDEFTPGSRGETEENDILSYLTITALKEEPQQKIAEKKIEHNAGHREKGKKGRKKKGETAENAEINHPAQEFNLADTMTEMLKNLNEKEKILAQNFISHTSKADAKLQALIQNVLITNCFKAKRNVVIFCRFIDTAQYLYHELSQDASLNAANVKGKLNCEIRTLTGKVTPEERDYILDQLKEHQGLKILVCTDCLSEGVNLQELFDTIVHYDYSWNPNRHEQREGRIDRLLQKSPIVNCYYMHADGHPIEKLFIEINEKKQDSIERSLGIRFQMSDIFSELNFVENNKNKQDENLLTLFDDTQAQQHFVENAFRFKKQSILTIQKKEEEQKKSQTYYSHESVKIGEVKEQLDLMRQALGSDTDVKRFFLNVLERSKGQYKELHSGVYEVEIPEKSLAQRIFHKTKENQSYKLAFELGLKEQSDKVILRTSPEVEDLARSVLEAALDPLLKSHPLKCASRAGVMRTNKVTKRTTVILSRLRYLLREEKDDDKSLVEEIIPILFEGSPAQFSATEFMLGEKVENFLNIAQAEGNVSTAERERFLKPLLDASKHICHELKNWQHGTRTQELVEIHKKIRAQRTVRRIQIEAVGLPDILGMYVFLPVNIGSGV